MTKRTRVRKDEARELVIDRVLRGDFNPHMVIDNSGYFLAYMDRTRMTKCAVIYGTYTPKNHPDIRRLQDEPTSENIGRLIDVANEVHLMRRGNAK